MFPLDILALLNCRRDLVSKTYRSKFQTKIKDKTRKQSSKKKMRQIVYNASDDYDEDSYDEID
jgi:hypothetical protein